MASFSVESGNNSTELNDTLPHTNLTERALREIDHRTQVDYTPEKTAQTSDYKNIQEFARHGGPDLSDLRWYPEPEDDRVISLESPPNEERLASPWDVADDRTTFLKGLWTEGLDLTREEYEYISVEDLMTAVHKRCGSQGSADVDADVQSARARQGENRPNKRPKPSSAYDPYFQVKLERSHVYFITTKPRSMPGNLEQASNYLSKRRASLSAENFGQEELMSFRADSYDAETEATVMRNVVPIIAGKPNYIKSQDAVSFRNLKPVAAVDIVQAVPDFYDGSSAIDLEEEIIDELNEFIRPAATSKKIVPNFFFEGKRPQAEGLVAELQVLHGGALGARCMHKLRNYGRQEESYDGNAYSWSATFFNGTLRLFAHYVTAPRTPGGKPDYWMWQVWGGDLCSNPETFVKGATALRNMRDLALAQRTEAINEANARARARPESELDI